MLAHFLRRAAIIAEIPACRSTVFGIREPLEAYGPRQRREQTSISAADQFFSGVGW
jgi:hypothetical protein